MAQGGSSLYTLDSVCGEAEMRIGQPSPLFGSLGNGLLGVRKVACRVGHRAVKPCSPGPTLNPPDSPSPPLHLHRIAAASHSRRGSWSRRS